MFNYILRACEQLLQVYRNAVQADPNLFCVHMTALCFCQIRLNFLCINEAHHEKTNDLVSNLPPHNAGCTTIQYG